MLQKFPVNLDSMVSVTGYCICLSRNTIAKVPAIFGVVHNIISKGLAFRIAAPLATQRATFVKDDCPDTFAIVCRKPLNIENHVLMIFSRAKIMKYIHMKVIWLSYKI
jgi:hypothetical protein